MKCFNWFPSIHDKSNIVKESIKYLNSWIYNVFLIMSIKLFTLQ